MPSALRVLSIAYSLQYSCPVPDYYEGPWPYFLSRSISLAPLSCVYVRHVVDNDVPTSRYVLDVSPIYELALMYRLGIVLFLYQVLYDSFYPLPSPIAIFLEYSTARCRANYQSRFSCVVEMLRS